MLVVESMKFEQRVSSPVSDNERREGFSRCQKREREEERKMTSQMKREDGGNTRRNDTSEAYSPNAGHNFEPGHWVETGMELINQQKLNSRGVGQHPSHAFVYEGRGDASTDQIEMVGNLP